MKKYLLLFLIIPSIASAQYVASELQQRIQNDQTAIALDNADMQAKLADLANIANDPDPNAQAVIAGNPDLQAEVQTATASDNIAVSPVKGVATQVNAVPS